MNNIIVLVIIALVAGAFVPLQGAVNNRLSIAIDSPVLAALVSFVVGTAALLVFSIISGVPFLNLRSPNNAPTYSWLGGILGAFFVAATVLLLPRLGVALTFGLIVAGQMLFTLVIDHFGLMEAPVKTFNMIRFIGVVLIIGGVALIRKF